MEAPGLGSEVAGAGAKQGWAELEGLLRTIDKSSNRLDSLDSIREAVKGNGCLPDPPLRARLVRAASSCASDPNSRIASKWLQFMAELTSQFGEAMIAELDVLLPACIEAMGSSSASVRQAAVQTMCACGKVRDHDVRVVLRGVAECIEHSPVEEQRAECCAALVTIYSTAKYRSTGTEALALQETVVPALAPALSDASPTVARSAAHALEAVRARSPEALQAAVEQLPADLQKVILSKLSAGAAASAQEDSAGEDTSHRDAGSMGDGGPEAGGGADTGAQLSLSFVPARVLAELQDANNWRVRALAVEELQQLVKAVREPSEMAPHLSQLIDFLLTLLHDPNFKIEITALQTIGDVISLMGADIRPFEPLIMPHLQEKLGDNKTLVRHANAKVVVKMMCALGADGIVSTLLKDLTHENWRVREEILVLLMQAMLSFEKRLKLEAIVSAVAPLLEDEKTKVKLTAIEALALVHAALGPDRLYAQLPLLDGAARRMLDVRLTQPQLPTLNSEGLLELPALRGQGAGMDDTPTPGSCTPRGSTRAGDRPPGSPMRRDRSRPWPGGEGEREDSSMERERLDAVVSPSRRLAAGSTLAGGMGVGITSPVRFSSALNVERTDSPRAGRRAGEESPRMAPSARRGSQSNGTLELELGALLAGDDQPLYSEVTVDDRGKPGHLYSDAPGDDMGGSRTSTASGILRSPRRTADKAQERERLPEGGEESRRRAPIGDGHNRHTPEDGSLGDMHHDMYHVKKPIKPFWMDGLRSDTGAGGDGRDALARGGGMGPGASAMPALGGGRGGMGGMGPGPGGDPLRGDQFHRGTAGPRMRPPSAGRRAAQPGGGGGGGGGGGFAGMLADGPGMSMVGAWGCGVEDTRFETLHGVTNSSPMVCSPPLSPQSVRACVSPANSGLRYGVGAPVVGGRGGGGSLKKDRINVPVLEKAYSEDIGRGPASVPLRGNSGGGMGRRVLGDDLSLSQEKIASRLSILKTRRGRTSSSRRATNSMSAPADESSALGLGDTRPGSSLFASSDLRPTDTPVENGGGGRDKVSGYRPSQSAPSSHTTDKDERLREERERRAYEMELAEPPPGAHRSVIDINAKPIELLATEDLKPSDSPDGCMKSLISKLGSTDWAIQMEALNNLRALAIYHASITIIPQLHAVVRAVLLVVDNLRSNLSKSALMSLTDMLKYLKTAMDPELDHVVLVCVKKSADTAAFIADEAKRAMLAMIEHCTEQRTISALIHANSNKNPLIRGKVALFVCAIIESMGSRLCHTREQERLFPLVVHYLSEGNAEPRAAGKKAILELHEHNKDSGEFERLLRRCADADVRVVEKLLAQEQALSGGFAVTNHSHRNLGASMTRSNSHGPNGTLEREDSGKPPRGRRSNMSRSGVTSATAGSEDIRDKLGLTGSGRSLPLGSSDLDGDGSETLAVTKGRTSIGTRKSTRGSAVGGDSLTNKSWMENSGLDRLPAIQTNITASDFRQRHEAVQELTDLLLREKQTCSPKTPFFVDLYVARLSDNNVKVAATALQGVDRMVGSYGSALESSLGLLVPALASNLSNTSPQLRTLAATVLESMCTSLEASALVQPLSAAADFGNQRAKASLLDKMRGLVRKVADRKPQLLHKFFVASAVKSLDDHKADVRGANNMLIKELYSALGDSMFSSNPRLPERHLSRLKEVVASNIPAQPSLSGLSIN